MNTGNANRHTPAHAADVSKLRIRNDVRFRIIDEEALILRQNDAEVLGLNSVGTRILEAVAEQRSLADMVTSMQEEFEVEPAQLEDDIRAFLVELQHQGVLEAVTGSEPGERS